MTETVIDEVASTQKVFDTITAMVHELLTRDFGVYSLKIKLDRNTGDTEVDFLEWEDGVEPDGEEPTET